MPKVPATRAQTYREQTVRKDAVRNRHALAAAAATILANQPNAPLSAIADAAGVHRATAHRHFDRQDIVMAARDYIFDEVLDALRLAGSRAASPVERLLSATRDAIAILAERRPDRLPTNFSDVDVERRNTLDAIAAALLEDVRAAKPLRRDVSTAELVTAWRALVAGLAAEVSAGQHTPQRAARLVVAMLDVPA